MTNSCALCAEQHGRPAGASHRAKLTWDDLSGFLRRTGRSGFKGIALLFAALVGVGSVLVEANFVSALILLGSGLGFAFSFALKSDKGGMLSAALFLRHHDDLAATRAPRPRHV